MVRQPFLDRGQKIETKSWVSPLILLSAWGLIAMKLCLRVLLCLVSIVPFFHLFAQSSSDRAAVKVAAHVIRPEQIRAHMRFLSDSLLQGRAPGTPGYDVAANYVASQLEGMGLRPGVSGGWFQTVPLQWSVVDPKASSLTLTIKGTEKQLVDAKDYLLSTRFTNAPGKINSAEADANAPVFFVGFGITAPGLNYDDYAGVDVRGKIIVTVFGAPSSFPSTKRAYYSDVTVKTKIALAHGAIAMFTIMLPEDWQMLPWDWQITQVQTGEMHWQDNNGISHDFFPELKGSALFSPQGAELLLSGAPKTLEQVLAAAKASKPQAFALPITAHIHTAASQKVVKSSNIVAVLEGSDPALRGQYVVYSAHVDHVGICPAVEGDNVCHGACDNASGTAALLEIARAYASQPHPPRRSILFVFVTGEEMGLLGSDYFAHFPTVPLKSIVADLNIDVVPGTLFAMKDVVALGSEVSSLGNEVAAAGKVMGYDISPDPMPEQVAFIRSDQYSFVLQGVPALWIVDGVHPTDPKINAIEVNKNWIATHYHTPLDNMNQPFVWESIAKATVMNFLVGYLVAQDDQPPSWNKGDFFGTTFGPLHN